MSIPAMNWAFAQRGLKPATKLVLVCLADCHNAHSRRCDPSQETLAEECCMSRSTVNVHLKLLEERGLIRRVQRSDKRTRKQLSSLYVLGCDMDEVPGGSGEKPVSEIRTRDQEGAERAVSGNRTRDARAGRGAVSEIRTRETRESRVRNPDTGTGRAVSGKQPIPCPENGQSRVRTVGHEPEKNLKGTLRAEAGAPGRARPARFFTDDERADAREVAAHLRRGGSVNAEGIPARVRDCLVAEEVLGRDELQAIGLG
ncbi:Helix-turn-helix domain-containing protein [Pseudooceanicola antarcticus]|uniref:Helix-turn-helix domain-containing protein n=1 Tax=Pseudooceanicola antarcticus TaxID=1247613 RepID=A0A285JKQ7_9RHOB|nr:helix-turn-helix domain-containing protein [Pseudooceanicola antarcticus]PJE26509.1 helix-turn-helix domain-containing protein [Pseudooceanicola antarcticus]SNY60854.1 Helix-turn-helix domain-containing protein [Pseudooceanicola antarcticus]